MGYLSDIVEGVNPYAWLIKLGLAVVLAAGLFGSGFYYGDRHVKTVYQSKVVKQVLVQTKYMPQETKYVYVASAHADANHEKAKTNVEALPANPVCDVPADTVGVLNANRGTLPSGQ